MKQSLAAAVNECGGPQKSAGEVYEVIITLTVSYDTSGVKINSWAVEAVTISWMYIERSMTHVEPSILLD